MAKLFAGKQSMKEEMAEAKALKSGKISKADYVKGEMAEGHSKKGLMKRAEALKSGKMSAKQYAKTHSEPKKMANGGFAERDVRAKTDGWAAHGSRQFKKMADGGMANCTPGMSGTGRRSMQDYGK
jgi:hypothetical protein